MIQQALAKLVNGNHLNEDEMFAVMRQIMTGEATDAQIGAFLTALRIKGETVEEVSAAVSVMRELVTPVKADLPYLVDTCGTGGDGANLFNVSTAAAFVVAAAGGHVAKHGNRAASSSTGSADVLEAAGVNLDINSEAVARAIEEIGVGFMFALKHHGAMKHAIGPRRQLAMRTIFNMLGPMTNPAGVKRQVIGVYSADICRLMAEVLQRLGSEHVLVVHASDGLDELTLTGASHIAELKDGKITEYELLPEAVGIPVSTLEGLTVNNAAESLQLISAAFSGSHQKASDIIALNAGAAIYVSGLAATLKMGVEMAEDVLASGAATEKLKSYVDFTQMAAPV